MRKAALDAIYDLARLDKRVVFIGSDLTAGVLAPMQREMPERFFMEGVSEAAIIGIAAGLASDGYIPYINTIATFITRRAYEQVALDLCLPCLPVRLIASGGGAVYAPLGPTHMATDDIALMRALPNMTIVAPVDAAEMHRTMKATFELPGPVYIRLAKGGDPIVSQDGLPFAIGTGIHMRTGTDVLFVTTGVMTTRALAVADEFDSQNIDAGVLHLHTVKPLDADGLLTRASRARLVVTVEEHSRIGGLGSAVAELFSDASVRTPLLRLGLPDRFSHDYGSQDHVLQTAGLDPAAIATAVRARLQHILEPAGGRR